MKDKIIRLAKALSNESVKRLPYIILIGLILIFIQFVHLNNQTAQGVRIATSNSVDSKTLLKKVAALSEDNKKLTQQNLDIAKENTAHLDCVAKLFAKYTRDLKPLYDINLDNCFIQEGAQMLSTASPAVSPQSLPNRSASSSKPTPTKVPPQLNIPPTVPKSPSLLERTVHTVRDFFKFLGL